MKYKKMPYEEFVDIYRKVHRIAVDVIVQTKNGIVLTKRSIAQQNNFLLEHKLVE